MNATNIRSAKARVVKQKTPTAFVEPALEDQVTPTNLKSALCPGQIVQQKGSRRHPDSFGRDHGVGQGWGHLVQVPGFEIEA